MEPTRRTARLREVFETTLEHFGTALATAPMGSLVVVEGLWEYFSKVPSVGCWGRAANCPVVIRKVHIRLRACLLVRRLNSINRTVFKYCCRLVAESVFL